MFGHWEIILIVLAVLLLFGGKKIPELMRGLGSGVKEFKKGIKEGDITEEKSENGKDEWIWSFVKKEIPAGAPERGSEWKTYDGGVVKLKKSL